MTLKDVLEEICAEEYALPANAPRHRFKRQHRRAVNAILYPNGLPKTENKLPLKRKVLVITAVVVLAVVTGAASLNHYNGFSFHKDDHEGEGYYIMFAENRENAPKKIEKLIYDDNMPKDFTLADETYCDDGYYVEKCYVTKERFDVWGRKKAFVDIVQCTKSLFVNQFRPELYIIAPIKVKDRKGFTIIPKDGEAPNLVMWSSDDYIHTVRGTLTIEELLEIAENMIALT